MLGPQNLLCSEATIRILQAPCNHDYVDNSFEPGTFGTNVGGDSLSVRLTKALLKSLQVSKVKIHNSVTMSNVEADLLRLWAPSLSLLVHFGIIHVPKRVFWVEIKQKPTFKITLECRRGTPNFEIDFVF